MLGQSNINTLNGLDKTLLKLNHNQFKSDIRINNTYVLVNNNIHDNKIFRQSVEVFKKNIKYKIITLTTAPDFTNSRIRIAIL